jgi:hypothetical protein
MMQHCELKRITFWFERFISGWRALILLLRIYQKEFQIVWKHEKGKIFGLKLGRCIFPFIQIIYF